MGQRQTGVSLNQLPWHSEYLCCRCSGRKAPEADGSFQGVSRAAKGDRYVSADHPSESFF
jgi:hypothetical protein